MNGLKKHLEKFGDEKPDYIPPPPTESARSLVLIKQIQLAVRRLCLAFGNGSW